MAITSYIPRSNNYYLAEILPQVSQLSRYDSKRAEVVNVLRPLFRSFFVKDLPKKLELLRISSETFVIWKSLGISISVLVGVSISALLFSITPLLFIPPILLISISVGFCIPDLLVTDRLTFRSFCIQKDLPFFMDLLVITISSSGYSSFPKAVGEAADGLQGVLAEELVYLTKKQHFLTIDEFLMEFQTRLNAPAIDDLVSSVKLVEIYGGSLEKKLSQLAIEAHQSRVLRAKEFANKASGTLLAPLLIFHLPVLLIVFLIPAVLAFAKGL